MFLNFEIIMVDNLLNFYYFLCMVTSKKDIAVSRKKIINATSKAIKDFSMIENDDFIMICISGGKDSYTMLDMMIHFQKLNFQFQFGFEVQLKYFCLA